MLFFKIVFFFLFLIIDININLFFCCLGAFGSDIAGDSSSHGRVEDEGKSGGDDVKKDSVDVASKESDLNDSSSVRFVA